MDDYDHITLLTLFFVSSQSPLLMALWYGGISCPMMDDEHEHGQ